MRRRSGRSYLRPVKRKVLVVGAGIAGLGAAVLLRRAGFDCEVYEASMRTGGLLAPVEFLGLPCDRGSHRVHAEASEALFDLTRGVAWTEQPRRGVLVIGGRHLAYPLEPVAFARALGLRGVSEMALGWMLRPRRLQRFWSWERDRRASGPDEGFEDFVLSRVGRVAYDRFYRPYVEKVWGVEPSRLSRSVARHRLSTSSPWSAVAGALRPGRGGATFLYPRHGVASLIETLVRDCERLGVPIHCGRALDRESLGGLSHDHVIHTGHLRALAPDADISHRGVYLLHLALPPNTLDDTDTWYVPESRYWFGRVSQPARFSPALSTRDADVLAVEIPEGRWGPSVNFVRDARELMEQLVDAGIVRSCVVPIDIRQTYVAGVYPMYVRGWLAQWQRALDKVRALGRVLPAGRQGLFLHCNMDHALHIVADAVEHLTRGGTTDAWIDGCARYLDLRVRD